MTSARGRPEVPRKRLGHIFGLWFVLSIGCGAALTFLYRSSGGEAYVFLAFGAVFGLLGGTVFTIFCVLLSPKGQSKFRFAVYGVVTAVIVIVVSDIRSWHEITWNLIRIEDTAACLVLGGVFGVVSGAVAWSRE